MNYNLKDIREELHNNIKETFDLLVQNNYGQFGPGIDFDKGLDLFFKTLLYRIGINDLDGQTKTLIPALHRAYISERGQLAPLIILSTQLEGYLKKIIFLMDGRDLSGDQSKTLIPLFNELSFHSTTITKATLTTLASHIDLLKHAKLAYETRNEVHKSPNWNLITVAMKLQSCMIIYLYSILNHYSPINSAVSHIIIPDGHKNPTENESFNDPNTRALFDFVSYNNGTFEIRNQIVASFILHSLNENGGELNIEKIKDLCNKQFNTNADIAFYSNIIKNLAKKGNEKVIIKGVLNNIVSLSSDEKIRIEKFKEDFAFQKQIFFTQVAEILRLYGTDLESKLDEIVVQLTILIESNYNIDLKEILDKGFEAKDNFTSLKEFESFLRKLSLSEQESKKLLKELIVICSENDFLHRVSAFQAFSKVTNPALLQEYINQQERHVYLDTNVLLYALCYYYEDDNQYNNIRYQSIVELLKFTDNHDRIQLKTSMHYVIETANHFKEALLLIPFEEAGLFSKIGDSNNVFYNFYLHLRQSDLLDDDVHSFADFMAGFDLKEEDLNSKNLSNIISKLVIEFLTSINIEVIDLPIVDYKEKEDVIELVKNVLSTTDKLRDIEPIKNDAYMICYLSNNDEHINEPIFATWDSTFFEIRRRYFQANKGSKVWHLFTPTKLINHLQLLEFRINAQSVTNDFLSIIDGQGFKEKTKNVLDNISLLFDINTKERRKYVSKIKEFNSKYVYNLNDTPDETTSEEAPINLPFGKIILELSKYYHQESTTYKFIDLKNVVKTGEFFDDIIKIFETSLELYSEKGEISRTIFKDFDALIATSKKKTG